MKNPVVWKTHYNNLFIKETKVKEIREVTALKMYIEIYTSIYTMKDICVTDAKKLQAYQCVLIAF